MCVYVCVCVLTRVPHGTRTYLLQHPTSGQVRTKYYSYNSIGIHIIVCMYTFILMCVCVCKYMCVCMLTRVLHCTHTYLLQHPTSGRVKTKHNIYIKTPTYT